MNCFDQMQRALRQLPDTSLLVNPFEDRSCDQLRRAVMAVESDRSSVGHGDLAGLTRHMMHRASLVIDHDMTWTVPKAEPWPDRNQWHDSHLQIAGEDDRSFRLQISRPWAADWLEKSDQFDPLEASYRETPRRVGWPSSPHLPLDTALQYGLRLQFAGYQGPGQRLAVRASFFLQQGGTLVVNLPTGTGKSLVAWAPALLSEPSSLTVMITPTIALAIDQERQLHEQYPDVPSALPKELAWHSGLSDETRKLIRERLKSRTQRILITSPESFVGSLSRLLYETAEAGFLKYFIVDEAHLIAQWGNDFRPEFQAMSGMRRDLLKECPQDHKFRTLLLSATLTQESFDVLESLFSEGSFDSVNSVSLRPEPEYWVSSSQTRSERHAKVIELLRVVPRPFLLYVTEQNDAEEWYRIFKKLGIKRSGCVHGGTPSDERERVISRWRSGDIDCVVATSAFGLGMDKSNIRTVIHACIPETIDRYYQEVGRAGRDGKASVSFLLPCPEEDEPIASSLGRERIISVDNGFERWSNMIQSDKAVCENGVWKVDLNSRSTHILQDSDANEAWNLRTLVLLNRAGIIRLESSRPPEIQQGEGESESEFDQRRQSKMKEFFSSAYLTVLNSAGHLDKSVWESLVKTERERMKGASEQSVARMARLLSGRHEFGEILRETYQIRTANGGAFPDHFCSGCPVCRSNSSVGNSYFRHPEPDPVTSIEYHEIKSLQKLFRTETEVVFVSVDEKQSLRERRKSCLWFVKKLASKGISEFAVPESWKVEREWQRCHEYATNGFVVNSILGDYDIHQNDLQLPRATFLFDEESPVIPESLINMQRPFHIVFAPGNSIKARSGRRFFDLHTHVRDYDLKWRLGE